MKQIKKILARTSLDEIGMSKSLPRLKSEKMYDYKCRVERAANNPPEPNFDSVSEYINLSLGVREKKIFKLRSQEEGVFPRLKVDSCFVYLFKDVLDDSEAELIKKWNYIEEIRYVYELIEEINKFNFVKAEYFLEEDVKYLEVRNLKIQDSLIRVESQLLNQTPVNRLKFKNIKYYHTSDTNVYLNEVSSPDKMKIKGDFHFNRIEGVLFSFLNPIGSISYKYYEDEYYVVWQPVKTWLLNDEAREERIKTTLRIKGKEERKVLTREGCEIINESLKLDPINWGE